jgi:hypothetical protein
MGGYTGGEGLIDLSGKAQPKPEYPSGHLIKTMDDDCRALPLARLASGRTASRKTTLRTVADAADVVSKSWTAAKQTTIR